MDDVFSIKIDYRKETADPARIFRAMSGLIDAVFQVERHLAHSLHASLEPVLLLQDIEASSIKAILRHMVRALDADVPLRDDWEPRAKRYIASGVVRIVEFMEGRETVTTREEIDALSAELNAMAAESQVTELPSYESIEPKRLLEDVSRLGEAASNLSIEDFATIESAAGIAHINSSFHLTSDEIEDLLTNEVVERSSVLILVVKKPDFLGQSMWQFKTDNHTIDAKILDNDWLERFQSQNVDLLPGDAIKAEVRSEVKLDFQGRVIAQHYWILRVLDVIPVDRSTQADLFG
jgi:hypothetical protein